MKGTSTATSARRWSILCDFDGTVTQQDVIDGLLERHGLPGWQQLEEDWLAGRIGSRECMQRQVALLDMDAGQLRAWLDAVPVDPDFSAFVAAARDRGHAVGIVSDGIDHAIHHILARFGLADLPVAANHWEPTPAPRRWRLTSPHAAADCGAGTCKCARIGLARSGDARPVLLIGDGRSDFCASGAADFVLAKGRLAGYCRERRIPHQPIAGFGAALELLPQLDAFLPA